MRKNYLNIIMIIIAVFLPLTCFADEIWIVSNIKGYSAYADENYTFAQDGLPNVISINFTEDGGSVTGSDANFMNSDNQHLLATEEMTKETKCLKFIR